MTPDHLFACYSHQPELFWMHWRVMVAELGLTPEQEAALLDGREPKAPSVVDAAHLVQAVPRRYLAP
jgi:hypothetical protein